MNTILMILRWQSSKKFQFGSVIRSKHLINQFTLNNYKICQRIFKKKSKISYFWIDKFLYFLHQFFKRNMKNTLGFQKIVFYFKNVLLRNNGIKAKVRLCKFDKIRRNPLGLTNISTSSLPILVVFFNKKSKNSSIL